MCLCPSERAYTRRLIVGTAKAFAELKRDPTTIRSADTYHMRNQHGATNHELFRHSDCLAQRAPRSHDLRAYIKETLNRKSEQAAGPGGSPSEFHQEGLRVQDEVGEAGRQDIS